MDLHNKQQPSCLSDIVRIWRLAEYRGTQHFVGWCSVKLWPCNVCKPLPAATLTEAGTSCCPTWAELGSHRCQQGRSPSLGEPCSISLCSRGSTPTFPQRLSTSLGQLWLLISSGYSSKEQWFIWGRCLKPFWDTCTFPNNWQWAYF